MTTLRAKLGSRGKLGAAVAAHRGQVRTALLAVLRPSTIFVPAPRTPHKKSLGAVGSNRVRSVAARTIGSKALCHLSGLRRGPSKDRCGSWLRENSEIEFANRNFVSTSINLKNKSAVDGCRDKTTEKKILRTFRARTFHAA